MTQSWVQVLQDRLGFETSCQALALTAFQTNNSSITSKRSVERLYFPNEPHFFRFFVKKPQRRSPLINRGYWLRMKAIDQVVCRFLAEASTKPKIIINLGCGYDPLPWQCFSRYPSACEGVRFVDIDYRDLMIKKRIVIQHTSELNSPLTNVEVSDGDVLFRSDQYLQLGCDLRDLANLERVLQDTIDINNCFVLFTAEVSITYMDVDAADALIKWAAELPEARFCLLEQLLPDGEDHPFAAAMMAHFSKLQTRLGAVQKYPTTDAQSQRFRNLGWPNISTCNLWELWGQSNFASSEERKFLDTIEPFDEWEEFALFGCHYFLLVADTATTLTDIVSENKHASVSAVSSGLPDNPARLSAIYNQNATKQGYRRFGSALLMLGERRFLDNVGVFGGMGTTTRLNTYDLYSYGRHKNNDPYIPSVSSFSPSSRMCHTITDLGDTGSLLIGGRLSPDQGLTDCWLWHKWLKTWERVDDLPHPLYRHQAVKLGQDRVLVIGGRINSQLVSSKYHTWSRRRGWVECTVLDGEVPLPTYGSVLTPPYCEKDYSIGFLAGGISADGLLQQAIWRWQVSHSEKDPNISFIYCYDSLPRSPIIRFGANVVSHQGKIYIIGGIIKDQILKSVDEICAYDVVQSMISACPVIIDRLSTSARPLLIGTSAMSIADCLIITGGAAVCFSFGTFWNKGCLTLLTGKSSKSDDLEMTHSWSFLQTVAPKPANVNMPVSLSNEASHVTPTIVPRTVLKLSSDFIRHVDASKPVIFESMELGSCTSNWTTAYLKEAVGAHREVIVHKCVTEHMDFKSKNFEYVKKSFGDFLDEIESGKRLYLRSLSSDNASSSPAELSKDFPSISADFRLPPALDFVKDNAHSSPLRISGPVIMWLHYDVMANVLCQIKGTKKLLLYPPSDSEHLEFEPGASSSHINVFEGLHEPNLSRTHPHEVLLTPGDVLFIPPLWLHTASPTSGTSVAVNVFFRNFKDGYSVGRDAYGNRDLWAYEKGRQDVAKIVRSFDGLPPDARKFYLKRLAGEFIQQSS